MKGVKEFWEVIMSEYVSINKICNEFLKVAKTGILPDGDHINEPTRLWLEKISEELKSWITMKKNII